MGRVSSDRVGRPAAEAVATTEEGAVYIKAPLKAGDVVSHPDSSVVVMGDVPEGCKIVAGGDVVVLGRCV